MQEINKSKKNLRALLATLGLFAMIALPMGTAIVNGYDNDDDDDKNPYEEYHKKDYKKDYQRMKYLKRENEALFNKIRANYFLYKANKKNPALQKLKDDYKEYRNYKRYKKYRSEEK